MKRGLINIERKVIAENIGRADLQIVICAICFSENPGYSIDRIEICDNFNKSRELEKKLKKEYPQDEIRILITKTRRIK